MTLQSTALVHEVYLRLVRTQAWIGRIDGIFRAVGADHAPHPGRRSASLTRGGAAAMRERDLIRQRSISIGSRPATRSGFVDLRARRRTRELAKIDPRRAKVIELRFFGGFSVQETADVLQISPQSVMRDWRLARAWLARELGGGSAV
jgi:DNA-directed RNA polymerase specialized sigma24 family protein